MKILYRISDGAAVSMGTVVADPLPEGLAVYTCTQSEIDGLRSGAKRWDPTSRTVVDTPGWVDPAVGEANRVTILDQAAAAMSALQAIIDTPLVSFSNVAGAQTAVRGLQAQVKDEARVLRRLVRLAVADLTGTD